MPTVRLNYDGWLAVPAGMRAKLGLSTGDQIDLELVDGSITLRPHRRDADRARPDTEPVVSAEPADRGTRAAGRGSSSAGREARSGPSAQERAAGRTTDAQGPR